MLHSTTRSEPLATICSGGAWRKLANGPSGVRRSVGFSGNWNTHALLIALGKLCVAEVSGVTLCNGGCKLPLSVAKLKAGLHVRRKHKHKHTPRVNRDDASTSTRARSFFLCLCLRRTCKPVFRTEVHFVQHCARQKKKQTNTCVTSCREVLSACTL